jgi:hypothetical protein
MLVGFDPAERERLSGVDLAEVDTSAGPLVTTIVAAPGGCVVRGFVRVGRTAVACVACIR